MQRTDDGLGYISTSDETRETLGTQIIRQEDSYDGHKQEVGETLDELGKAICKGLEDAINSARSKGIRGDIYIHIVETRLPPSIDKPVAKFTFFTRQSRPDPMWNTSLFLHKEGDSYPSLCWTLPEYQHSREITVNPNKYSPEQVRWVAQMQKGLLF